MEVDINYLAVLVAGISSMVVGSIIYAKPVLGKMWMDSMGFKDEDIQQGAGKAMGIAFVFALVMAYVLAHMLQLLEVTEMMEALQTAGWLWLGFVATSTIIHGMFNRAKMVTMGIFLLNQLLTLLAMAAILVSWT